MSEPVARAVVAVVMFIPIVLLLAFMVVAWFWLRRRTRRIDRFFEDLVEQLSDALNPSGFRFVEQKSDRQSFHWEVTFQHREQRLCLHFDGMKREFSLIQETEGGTGRTERALPQQYRVGRYLTEAKLQALLDGLVKDVRRAAAA